MGAEARCAVVIFAKAPRPGQVKTRLTRGESRHLGAIEAERSAALYAAFLRDYARRFADPPPGLAPFFCVREALPERESAEVFGAIPVIVEPSRDGRRAADLGEAMAWTMQDRFDAGFERVILLGSDLPHLPFFILERASDRLERASLVLGDDGGGCYLIGATGPAAPEILSSGLPWSQGQDFALLREGHAAGGGTVAVLEAVFEDIDGPRQLDALIDRLKEEQELRRSIPETTRALRSMGASIPAKQRTRKDVR